LAVDTIRLVHWGLGAMGAGMVRLAQQKDGLRSVGAVARTPSKQGRDLGEVAGLQRALGVKVAPTFAEALPADGADLALISTASFTREVAPEVVEAASAGLNVITIAEEMAYPWRGQPELARTIDAAARERGVTVLGTGINPGFVLDTLIVAMTAVCEQVDSIRAARINDLSPFGPTVLRTQGVGTTPEQFERGLRDGTIVGHVGFPESMSLIARALGWKLAEIREERQPIISETHRETPYVKVEPGRVAGCRQVGYGYGEDGRLLIKLEHPQQIHPEAEGVETGDYIWIEGLPPVNLAVKPEIPGGTGTIAVAVNMIPLVVAAPPGLVDMTDLPVPRAIAGDLFSSGRRG
jgi:4-hydroxy-tetrahydrodipicolinate reductase